MFKLTLPCRLAQRKISFAAYLGHPADGEHPIGYQTAWLEDHYGAHADPSVMADLRELGEAAERGQRSPESLWREWAAQAKRYR